MAAIAELLAARGHEVSGSDAVDSEVLVHLRSLGVDARVGHEASRVDGAELVVFSTAVRESNPEMVRAGELGVPVMHRSEGLALLARSRRVLAVAGAHGKTTTTAMAAVILREAGLDPSYAIGGAIAGEGSGARAGSGSIMVIEADESDGSFLRYWPEVAVVTNVEPDHLDHFGTQEAFFAAFEEFAAQVSGLVVACADDPGSARIAAAARGRGVGVVTYGFDSGADAVLGWDVVLGGDGVVGRWVLRLPGGESVSLALPTPGVHYALDASAALLAVHLGFGVEVAAAASALESFAGTERRCEVKGKVRDVIVLDDYAHHPTEIRAFLAQAREIASGRVLVVFQPHLYSRTANFAAEFAAALSEADATVMMGIYPAREDPIPGVTSMLIAERMPGDRVEVVDGAEEAIAAIVRHAQAGDVVATVGAGDVTQLGAGILRALGAGGLG